MDLAAENKELREKLKRLVSEIDDLRHASKTYYREKQRLESENKELQERIDEITMYIPKIGEKSKSYAELESENATLVEVARFYGNKDIHNNDCNGYHFNHELFNGSCVILDDEGKLARDTLEKFGYGLYDDE